MYHSELYPEKNFSVNVTRVNIRIYNMSKMLNLWGYVMAAL